MKSTIHGFRYDTEKAEKLAERKVRSRTSWLVEALYRTPRGHYFLCGQGGPDSIYGRWIADNARTPGAAIHPMSPMAAKRWAEKYAKKIAYRLDNTPGGCIL